MNYHKSHLYKYNKPLFRQEKSIKEVILPILVLADVDVDNQVDVIVRRKKIWLSTMTAITQAV